ncbi:hypothetical protein YPPY47_1589 [Yersinia pestis PY-47]|uniref:Uncharacterized protein n=1 Tax=Yersinia pestis PY-08 TaxID=992134 RepID=A0AB72ZLI5_YERPE|nr:hypothetical protein YPPY02_1458 [Yersinia pestis PY-02]EIQ93987.1 hypothetical protein YPPY03_1532 [Yersinia pestis PY-03]EIR05505.1 hypothetical protein YPPY04_1496 [Yersinia pestis PY-04]EIR06234.1 hypothetical protein YPPY05_1471 [Yersinia pestis PY-05]EIR21372.1 hypothetical protein YPPY08_1516 [Yersinia pestis PY-08]EIR50060.1 hypothetical protein YPPY15_1473 [Yersinia pestis PY-15]EIR67721.1 hypothetical protein YPPY25_1518 [Yersinia pestis PY-25]EIR79817.1 hypothetical protein YPP
MIIQNNMNNQFNISITGGCYVTSGDKNKRLSSSDGNK